jgi:uncharacterized protein (TIGR03083 family)
MDDIAAAVPANLEVLRAEGDRLAAVAADRWDDAVATCPGWTVAATVVHTGGVHRWVHANLSTKKRTRRQDLPDPPDGREARIDWFREGLVLVGAQLEKTDPDQEVWAFGASGERRAGWWARRMAQETAVHRWDVEAAGTASAPGFAAAFAVEGIEEYLYDFLPGRPATVFDGLGGTLHLHTTDADGEWVIDLDEPGLPARREHAKSDTAVRGPASDLLLWLWNRQAADGHLETFGDAAVVEGWTRIRI